MMRAGAGTALESPAPAAARQRRLAVARRQFFAISGLAAAVQAGTSATGSTGSSAAERRGTDSLLRTIDLQSDGLALSPREYTTLLSGLPAQSPPEPDYYSNGGAVGELERTFARLLAKEAAVFLPTGTLANHVAVRKLAGAERRVLVPAESHLYNDSGDCAQSLSGLNLIPLGPGKTTFDPAEVESWCERSEGGRVETPVGAIVIESPVRRRNHEMFDPRAMEEISAYARGKGIRLHLDGARMFTLPYHSGKSVREYASWFDTVYVSIWKHFNGASGAILAGTDTFIRGLFQMRRMFGGSLPQAWPLIALVAQSAERFEADYGRAWRIADELIALLATDRRFRVIRPANGTSRFFLSVEPASPVGLSERLLQKGVVLAHPQPDTGLIPVQINLTLLRTTPEALFSKLVSSL
jgi:threonine aldolase